MRIDGYAEDVFEMKTDGKLRCCDYCGGDREIALLSTIGAQRLCESCATLSLDERKEVKKFHELKEILDHDLEILKLKTYSEAEDACSNGNPLYVTVPSSSNASPSTGIDTDAIEIIEEMKEILKKKDQKRLVPCPDPDSKASWDGHQWNACTNRSIELPDATRVMGDRALLPVIHCEECPDPKYDGSLWEYCGEGFRVHWDGHQWNARCTNPCAIYISIFEDVDPVAMEVEGFWNIIEYGGCISTHEKPKPLRRNPNKAPEIKVPWDPFW
jgi:hypothetical protein